MRTGYTRFTHPAGSLASTLSQAVHDDDSCRSGLVVLILISDTGLLSLHCKTVRYEVVGPRQFLFMH